MADTKTVTPEEQIADLQNKLTLAQAGQKAAEASKTQLATENADLKKAAQGDKDTTARAIADKDAQIANLKAEADKKDKAISKLQTLVQKAVNDKENSVDIATEEKPVPTPMDVVTVEGEKYRFKKPLFMLPGNSEVHKAEEALHNEEVLKALIAVKGQTTLEKVA